MQNNQSSFNKEDCFGTIIFCGFSLLLMLSIFFADMIVNLECQKSPSTEVYCQLNRTQLFLLKTRTQILAPGELKGATVKEHEDGEGDTSYQIILNTQKGNIRFIFTSSRKDAENRMNQINDFLDKSDIAQLNVTQNNIFEIVGLLIVFVFLLAIFLFNILLVIMPTKKPHQKALLFLEKKT